MRRLTGLLLIAFLFSGYVPNVAHALSVSESATRQDAVMNDTDDIAACADDPAPSMNGYIPGLAGKPINLLAGAETTSRTDLTIGNLYPIAVRRIYNSRSGYDSPLGYGWAVNYDRRLYTYPDGSVTLRKECGWKRRFSWNPVDVDNNPYTINYITPLGESGTLVQNADNSYTFTDKSGARDVYDPQGRLIQLIDATGASITITYTAQVRDGLMGLLLYNVGTTPLIVAYDYKIYKIEEKNASGNLTGAQVTFIYDLNGRLSSITDSRRTVNYGHDNIGNLTSVTGPEANITYGYTNPNNMHLMTSVDEGKGEYVNTYTNGRVTRQTHGTGVIDFEYLAAYAKTKVTTTIKDSSGAVLNTNIRTVEFGENGQVVKETDTVGNVTTYARNSQTKITREEYWENTGTVPVPVLVLRSANDFTYDTYGNLKTKTEASKPSPSDWAAIQKTTTYIYQYEIDPLATTATFHKVAQEIVKSVVDPNQNKTVTNTYDNATGNLLTTTDAGLLGSGTAYSNTTTYGYTNGKLTSIDGPRTDVTDVTSYAYDPTTGYLTSLTQPIIGTTTYSNHDALGNPRNVLDPNGNSTAYTYDENGRVLTVTAAGDTSPTQYAYVVGGCTSCGGANKIDHITLPEGNTITYGYDANSNLASISDSLGNSINYTYDSEGNKLTEEIRDAGNSLQKSLSYQYDALNRLKRTTNPDTSYTEYSYDSRGNRLSLRTPNSTLTTYSYDALNRLTATIQPGTITTGYGYNANNNLTTVTDANSNATTYIYDDKGRVYQVISPDTGTTTYTYDPAGNLMTKTDAKGITISYTYDALNRLTTIDYPADTDTVYSYDTCLNGKGRLCSMTDASGTTTYEYTPKGQVKKETKVIDTVTYVTQYTYDQNGNLKTMTYPSGKVITYNYTNDRAVSVLNGAANLASSITYKPFGGMNAITYGNGLSGTIGYDNQYRISSITAGAVLNLGYTGYDSNGNITAITDSLDASKNKSFTYDNLDRLWTATSTGIWGSLAWTYDGVGNRQTENTNAYTYYQNTNKLNTANGITFGYDNNGNTTTEAARQYVYNQNQRLIQVNDGSMTANYTYNGNGQRVKKVVNGTTSIFHYSLRWSDYRGVE